MAFPSTAVLDTFTGTNGDDLPTYSGNWQAAPTGGVNLEIQSNAATGTAAASNNTNSWAADFGPDCEVYVTITTKPADGNVLLLVARGVQTTSLGTIDGYCLRFAPASGTDSLIIQRIDNGAQSNLVAPISQEVSNGDSLGLEIVGNTLTAYYKASGGSWTSVGTVTDSTYSAAGKIGILTSSNTIRLDDFGGGTYVSGGGSYTLDANAGSFALAGQQATLSRNRVLDANAGSFALAGQTAEILKSKSIIAVEGAFTLAGQQAELVYTPLAAAYTLDANAGSFALTGQQADLLKSYVIDAQAGAFALTGQDAVLAKGRVLDANAGSFSLAGQDATLLKSYVLDCEAGSFILTGRSATIEYSGAPPVSETPLHPISVLVVSQLGAK